MILKSDAPQFKGKSDKKKEKMAVAAYLDSKEEVELEEGECLLDLDYLIQKNEISKRF